MGPRNEVPLDRGDSPPSSQKHTCSALHPPGKKLPPGRVEGKTSSGAAVTTPLGPHTKEQGRVWGLLRHPSSSRDFL